MSLPLSGLSVLVTRPQHQAEAFCLMLENAGAKAIRFPALHIESTALDEQTTHLLERCDQQDIIIFTSSNAVTFSLHHKGFHDALSQSEHPCSIAAIGGKTAQALKNQHIAVDIQPSEYFNSESLLALPAMQHVNNKHILIIKGEGGRSLLGDILQSSGAHIHYANVYYRKRPTPDTTALDTLTSKKIDIITLTSAESSYNLITLLKHHSITGLSNVTWLLGSQRIYQAIADQPIMESNPHLIATNPSDHEMFSALLKWKTQHIEPQ